MIALSTTAFESPKTTKRRLKLILTLISKFALVGFVLQVGLTGAVVVAETTDKCDYLGICDGTELTIGENHVSN
jgi:hypothetical protein